MKPKTVDRHPLNFPPALMRPPEAATYLALSLRHMATMTARGDVPCVRMGRKCVRYRRTDLDRFIDQRAG